MTDNILNRSRGNPRLLVLMVRRKIKIIRENREDAVAWVQGIISASRSTDILAFYSDWFFHRLKVGYFMAV